MILVFRALLKRVWPATRVAVLALLLSLLAGTAFAGADSLPRGFKAKGDLPLGSMVAIVKDDASSVELVPAGLPDRIYGVIIGLSEAPVSIQNKTQQVVVATSGIYSVLADKSKGAISSGDYLSMSSTTDGVAAKALSGDTYIVGRATEDFSSSDPATSKIRVQILPGKNPLINNGSLVPNSIRHLAESVAGRPLSVSRIYIVLTVFLITLILSFTLIWVGVRSGMVSIGRNPLSRHSIMHSLSQVIISAIAVFFAGIVGIFLLLKL